MPVRGAAMFAAGDPCRRVAPSDVECAVRLGPLGGDVRVEVWFVAGRGVHLLPFVVHVRRTAELLSKVVLLAGDHLMQYTGIRGQLRV
jgi:hypothetical protein